MINNAEKLLWVEASSPQKLKDVLNNIERPWQAVEGSWYHNGFKWGVWVITDLPVTQTKKKKPKAEKKVIEGNLTFKED